MFKFLAPFLPWIYGAVVGAFVLMGVAVWTLDARLDTVKTERDNAVDTAKATDGVLREERTEAREANDRMAQLQADKRASDEKLQVLTDCVANLTCGVRVKTVRVTVPQAEPGTTGVTGADAGHCEISGPDYRDLRAAIALTADRYRALQRELIARSQQE